MEEKIVCRPIPTASEIIELIKDDIIDPPEEITISLTLKGIGAKRYNFVTKLLEASFGESQEEIAKFLITSGVEREIEKITQNMAHLNEEDADADL